MHQRKSERISSLEMSEPSEWINANKQVLTPEEHSLKSPSQGVLGPTWRARWVLHMPHRAALYNTSDGGCAWSNWYSAFQASWSLTENFNSIIAWLLRCGCFWHGRWWQASFAAETAAGNAGEERCVCKNRWLCPRWPWPRTRSTGQEPRGELWRVLSVWQQLPRSGFCGVLRLSATCPGATLRRWSMPCLEGGLLQDWSARKQNCGNLLLSVSTVIASWCYWPPTNPSSTRPKGDRVSARAAPRRGEVPHSGNPEPFDSGVAP